MENNNELLQAIRKIVKEEVREIVKDEVSEINGEIRMANNRLSSLETGQTALLLRMEMLETRQKDVQAEQVKIQCGSCFGQLAPENKMITIPGVCGRDPRVVSFKLLANIIEARMEEIIEAVMFEVERSGYADKLAAGVVVTGGGALMKDLPQFIKFKTGMDVRIGKPLYLTGDSELETKRSSYSTVVGLLMKGFEYEELPLLHTTPSQFIEPEVVKEGISQKPRKLSRKELKTENKTEEETGKKKKQGGFIGGIIDSIPDFFGPVDDNV